MSKSAIERLIEFHDYLKANGYGGRNKFEKAIGKSDGYLSNALRKDSSIGSEVLLETCTLFPELNIEWLITGRGKMLKLNECHVDGTTSDSRPRIPMNAAAGSLSVALSGATKYECEEIPVIQSFTKYDYTVIVKGGNMEPEFHSGDELACLHITNANYIQWGRFHVLDTAQGLVVKRVYEKESYILCKSEESDTYPNFEIPKEEVYNVALVIGMLRRF